MNRTASATAYPIHPALAISEIWIDILLALLTCGIYTFFWQARQFKVLNAFLGHEKYNFWTWLALCIVTCGIFQIINQYMMACTINDIQRERGLRVNDSLPVVSLVLSIVFGGFFGSFIVDAFHQNDINNFFRE